MIRKVQKIVFFTFLFFSVGAFADQSWDSVSLIQLIANPNNFDNVQIAVSGYLHHRKDSSALYLSKPDADYSITKNAITIMYGKKVALIPIPEFKNQPDLSLDHFDSKYVKVYGVFASKFVEGTGNYSGTLYDVSRIEQLHRRYSGKAVLKRHSNE